MHELPLLINIAVALVAAFIGGSIARAVKLPTIVGYMLAGIAIGPFTPGYTGDVNTITQLAELGVIFLMFGVGLHFSLGDLWKVRNIAIPGAIGQMLITTLLGYLFAQYLGWTRGASIVLGLAISIGCAPAKQTAPANHARSGAAAGRAVRRHQRLLICR